MLPPRECRSDIEVILLLMAALRIILVCLRAAMLISFGYLAITERGELFGFAALLGFLIVLLWSTLSFQFDRGGPALIGIPGPDKEARSPASATTVSASSGRAPASPFQQDRSVELQTALGDNYRVGKLLGKGGFGQVFAVRDIILSRDLAVKLLDRYTSVMLPKFAREAGILAKLHHPNIVPVLFVGSTQYSVYMAMPLIRGCDLASMLLRSGPLSVSEVSEIVSGVANGLDEAHSIHVVHRDIKPANLFIEEHTQQVYILDFGVAKVIEEGFALPGSFVGTGAYMSPEQWTRDPLIDRRCDVYALGCVIHELLAGVPPFGSGRDRGGWVHLMQRHLCELPPSVFMERAGVSPATQDVVFTALAKDKMQRHQTAGDLARSFAMSLSG